MDNIKDIVDLGFAESCETELLTNRYFPSKIGGNPAWLELKNLPKCEDLNCANCNQPYLFLCQVYAPIETDPNSFHRTLYLFICRNEECLGPNCAKNIQVFRSQLKRQNDFYSIDPPELDDKLPAIPSPVKLCYVCGCPGPLVCGRCKTASYCSKAHQKIDWKNGHSRMCTSLPENVPISNSWHLPEYELCIESEAEVIDVSDNVVTEANRLQEYQNLVDSGEAGEMNDVPESELEQFASGNDDKQFWNFKKRIDVNPDQVLRYHRGGEPLWITTNTEFQIQEIPACEKCGSKRIFEFQVMPQMLNHLKDDKLDWGIIAVYTCSQSCDTNEYIKEFVIKQDIIKKINV